MSSIMDLLGGGGGPAGPGPAGPPPGPDTQAGPGMGSPGPMPGAPDNPDAEQALQAAIDALHAFIQAEEDDQDKTVATKALATLQGIFGGRQKQDESAQGITPAHKAMGRAVKSAQASGSPGGYGG